MTNHQHAVCYLLIGFYYEKPSAAAAAKIRGYNVSQIQQSLAIAATMSAGLRENFGTMTKPLHAGRAAESGVVACDLVGFGWSATDKNYR